MTGELTLKVLLMVLAPGATAQSEEPPSSQRLILVWADPYGLLRYGYDSMVREVVSIFDDAGVEVEWRKLAADVEPGSPMVIIHLTPAASTDFGLRDHAMGVMAHRPGTGGNRVVRIFFANVLRTLRIDYEKPHMPTARETMSLARALARVTAHEVVHAIVPEAPHTTSGLMQSRLTRTDLREVQNLRLSVESKRALLASLLWATSIPGDR